MGDKQLIDNLLAFTRNRVNPPALQAIYGDLGANSDQRLAEHCPMRPTDGEHFLDGIFTRMWAGDCIWQRCWPVCARTVKTCDDHASSVFSATSHLPGLYLSYRTVASPWPLYLYVRYSLRVRHHLESHLPDLRLGIEASKEQVFSHTSISSSHASVSDRLRTSRSILHLLVP